MRIKSDFVTNSSSTAYIVAIPKNWYLDEKQFLNEYYGNDGDLEIYLGNEEDLLTLAHGVVDALRNGDEQWLEDDFCGDSAIFWAIGTLIEKDGLELAQTYLSDGMYHFKPITQEQIETWLSTIVLDEIDLKGGVDVTKDSKK